MTSAAAQRSSFRDHAATKKTWHAMRQRCENPNDGNYARYGGRGISICARWKSYELFLADMGERPDCMSIDRIDGNGNYEPGNCRWASSAVQGANLTDGLTPEEIQRLAEFDAPFLAARVTREPDGFVNRVQAAIVAIHRARIAAEKTRSAA